MRIGFDFRMGGSINSGIGRYSFQIIKNILEVDSENQYVVIYNRDNVDTNDLDNLLKHKHVALLETGIRHYSVAEQLRLPKVLNRAKLDLVHFPNFNVPIRYKKPFVVTIHDVVHHRLSGHKKSRIIYFQGYKYVFGSAINNARAIITPSEAAKKDLMHYFPDAGNKSSVIYEAPSLHPQTPDDVVKVKKTFLLENPYFLFVGTLERKKNVPMLTAGFSEFIQKYKLNMDLVIAGKTDLHHPEEKAMALAVPHAERLVFTDFVSDADVAALYQGAFAYASASINEGFGLPGVEAMQFGLPLVAANTEVFNEIYDDAAIYFDATNTSDIAEKLHLLASDEQFYQQQRARSLNRSTKFSWEEAAWHTLEVYKKIVHRPSDSLEIMAE